MNNFRNMSQMIATEALVEGLPISIGTPTFLKVKGIAKAIGGWAKDKIRPDMRLSVVGYSKIRTDLEKANYADIHNVKVTVPRGLKGHLNSYVEELFDAFLLVENLNQDILVPFSTWLSLMLSSPGSLQDATAIKDLKNFRDIPVDKVQASLGGFVDPTSRRDMLEVKNVYPSITIMKITWDNVNALSTRYLETNPTKILKSVQEIAGKVDRLIQVVEEQNGTLSGQTATALAKLVAKMAEAVDMYGQLGILIREVAVACSRHVGELEKSIVASANRSRAVAMESLSLSDMVFTVGGRKTDLETLVRIIDRHGSSELVPMEDLVWVVEEEIATATLDEDSKNYENRMVYVVKYDDVLYPVENFNVIAAANAAGHASVECRVITSQRLIEILDIAYQ